jgi:hypothetical protein
MVWIDDHLNGVESNLITVELQFTRESVDGCLAWVKDPATPTYWRKWNGEFLVKLMPGLAFEWWDWQMPEDRIPALEKQVQADAARFEAWLKDPANADALTVGIDRINHPPPPPPPKPDVPEPLPPGFPAVRGL